MLPVTILSAPVLSRIRYHGMTFWCVCVCVCVCVCISVTSKGVLMPAASWHTQQMGERLIPCLLTVHLNAHV